jgi:hypothetical protein
MCLFCAAVPATLAIGAKAQAEQRRREKLAKENDVAPSRPLVPPKTVTTIVVAGLVTASIVYHTQNVP